MNFKFFIISILITSGFVGGAFADHNELECGEYQNGVCVYHIPEHYQPPKKFTAEEISELKQKAAVFNMKNGDSFTIEFFPEDAPNHVEKFLKLVESGFYEDVVFHRIIPGFMIQTGDPNTKDPEIDRSLWGQGGPGYLMREEFNTLQHDRGIVSMARSEAIDSAGSQFFIVHQEGSNYLDGKYTAFGRIISCELCEAFGKPDPGYDALDKIASLTTDNRSAPIDVFAATIDSTVIIDLSAAAEGKRTEPDRNYSVIKKLELGTKKGTEIYYNNLHKIRLDVPYRWVVIEDHSQDYLHITLEGNELEHNLQAQIEQSGFAPKVVITSAEAEARDRVSTGFFSIRGGDEPKVLSNYVFDNDDGERAHMMVTTQNVQTEKGAVQFKALQLHFINSKFSYAIVYVNVTDWFRYEVNAFTKTVENFEIEDDDGMMQPIGFSSNPVFQQVIIDAKAMPEEEAQPLARIGGCLIATASYGSELAPQVQLLREIRDNTVLQTQSGISFMTAFNQLYYSFSPTIADYERENTVFKEAVKLTLTPLLASLTLLQYVDIDSEYDMLGYGISIILLNIGMYFIAPAVLIMKIRSFYKVQ